MREAKKIHTKWNVEDKRWKIFTSIDAGSKGPAIDIFDKDKKILDPVTDKIKIKEVLEDNPDYKAVKAREDHNKKAVLTKHDKQKPKPGFYAESTTILIGTAVLIPLLTGITDLMVKSIQRNQNNSLSFKQVEIQSGVNFIIDVIVAGLGLAFTIYLLHAKHRKVMDAENAYETVENLLARLDDIEKEVRLKNRVVSKFDQLLQNGEVNSNISNDEYINEIIIALDGEDDLICWQSAALTLGTTDERLRLIRSHVLIDLKEAFKKEYDAFLGESNRIEQINESNTLKELFNVIERFPAKDENYEDKKIPKNFIYLYFAQAIQNTERWLVQETLKRFFNSHLVFASSSSENSNDVILKEISKAINSQYINNPEAAKVGLKYLNDLKPSEQNLLKKAIWSFLQNGNAIMSIIEQIMDKITLNSILHERDIIFFQKENCLSANTNSSIRIKSQPSPDPIEPNLS